MSLSLCRASLSRSKTSYILFSGGSQGQPKAKSNNVEKIAQLRHSSTSDTAADRVDNYSPGRRVLSLETATLAPLRHRL